MDERDWDTVTVSLFMEDNSVGDAAIGMNEKQGLSCTVENESNSSAYVVLGFMGQSATVKANASISDLRY